MWGFAAAVQIGSSPHAVETASFYGGCLPHDASELCPGSLGLAIGEVGLDEADEGTCPVCGYSVPLGYAGLLIAHPWTTTGPLDPG